MAFIRSILIPLIAAALGILTTLIAGRLLYESEQTAMQTEFERRSQVIANVIELQMRVNEDTLYSLRTLFHYSETVSRTEFAGAASDLMRNEGILALEWAARVPGSQRAATEAAVRAEGFPEFEFADLMPDLKLQRAPERAEYFPVLYAHPHVTNKSSLGFDLTSSVTWPGLQRAAAENRLAASERLPLITEGRKAEWGVLLRLPVYRPPIPDDPEQRRVQLRGYVIGVFRPADLVEVSMGKLRRQGVDVLLTDPQAPADRQLLHWHPSRTRGEFIAAPSVAEMAQGSFHLMIPLRMAGRYWNLYFRPTPEWLATQRNYYWSVVLLTGVLASLLLGFYLRGMLRRTDIVEQQVALRTAELQENRRQLSSLISQLPGAAFRCLFDEKMTALFVSEGMLPITGYPADDFTSGRIHIANLTLPQDRPTVRGSVATAIKESRSFEFEYRLTHREGDVRWVLVRGQPIFDEAGSLRFLEGLAIDVTALKQAESDKLDFERNLLETQKLESLGVMAGGIAHDFNNILTAVLGNASLARLTLDPSDTGHTNLEQIENAARRAADLCAQMLAYAGKGKISVGPIDLSNLVRDTASMLAVSVGKKCELVLDLASDLPPVLGDGAQLGQIVMNLVINGADAIGDRPGGRIKVTTFAREADAALFTTALHKPELKPGLYVGLEVRDNGCGIAPETLPRIFEPFFTTKFSGRGLGLSAVLGIVQSHQGALFVESEPGAGSTFRLLLPTAAAAPATRPEAASAISPHALRGTVLVVDDEEAVRNLVGQVLRRQGASAVLAADGNQALELFRQQRDAIDLIMLDLTMPGLSGEEVLRQLQQLGARQKIVVMSGYSEEDTMQRCAELGVAGFLRKPFELQVLMARLQSFLS